MLIVVAVKYRKWPFSAPSKRKTSEAITATFCKIDYVSKTTKCAEVHHDQHRDRGLPYGWSCLLSLDWVFPCALLGTRTADAERTNQTYYTSIDAVAAKEVPLMGFHRYISSRDGVTPQKHLIFWTSMGISSLKVYAHILAPNKRINMLCGSNAYLGKIHNLQSEKVGYAVISWVKFTFLQTQPQLGISSQNTLLNIF